MESLTYEHFGKIGFFIAALIAIVILLQRRRRGVDLVCPQIAATSEYPRPLSPLERLSFEEAKDINRFSAAISEYNRENLLFTIGVDPVDALIQWRRELESVIVNTPNPKWSWKSDWADLGKMGAAITSR
jgi:hypothetical protein